MRAYLAFCLWVTMHGPGAAAEAPPDRQVVPVFDHVEIDFDRARPERGERHGDQFFEFGQVVETAVVLPDAPQNQRDARQIVATLTVEPVLIEKEGKQRPGDPWTRLGSVTIAVPNAPPGAPEPVELMRFITGFGGPGTFTQDITALAPLLDGRTTFRVFISTFHKPAWTVSLSLSYSREEAGYRRPIWAQPILFHDHVTAEKNILRAAITVPGGLDRPRLHILSTGHATDGADGDEFISRTHVLRIDDEEIARWRPWAEEGGAQRSRNPASGRATIEGRELHSSDLDRSGWHPGLVVEPLRMPLPELTPGRHIIELEIMDIRPRDESGHGYWRTSAVAVADEPWPKPPDPEIQSPLVPPQPPG